VVKTEDRRDEDAWRRWVRGDQDTTRQRSTCSRPQSSPLNLITCNAVKEAARRSPMYQIGSYQYVFRPCHPSAELRSLDTWSKCTADVQSARYGPDGISREYRRERSKIPLSRRYLRNVAQCTVERPSKRPSSYMPKLYTDHLNSYIRKKHAETSADGCRLCQVQLLSATTAHRCFLRGSFRAPTEGGEASTG